MHGWKQVDTARCERCGVYSSTTDLAFSPDGRAYCCGGAPSIRPPKRVYVPAADVSLANETWAPFPQMRLEHHARVAALVMLAVTLCFPLAACVSQLSE
jgi:hypothetical protein